MRLHLQKWFFICEADRLNWLTLNKLDRTAVPPKLVDSHWSFSLSFRLAIRPPIFPLSLSPSSASSTGPFLHSALSCSPPPAGVSLISRLSIYFCVLLGCRLRSQVFTSHSNGTRDPDSSDNGKGRTKGKLRGVVTFKENRVNQESMENQPRNLSVGSAKLNFRWNGRRRRAVSLNGRTKMTKSRDSVINIWSSQPSRNATWRLIKNSLLIVSIDLSTWLGRDKSPWDRERGLAELADVSRSDRTSACAVGANLLFNRPHLGYI